MHFLLLILSLSFFVDDALGAVRQDLGALPVKEGKWGFAVREREEKDVKAGGHGTAIQTLEDLLAKSTAGRDNRGAIVDILTSSNLRLHPATERERLIITESWNFVAQHHKTTDFTRIFKEKFDTAINEMHRKHYQGSALMASYLQIRAGSRGTPSPSQIDGLARKLSPLFLSTVEGIKGYIAAVERDMKKIDLLIKPEAERFDIAAVVPREPDFLSFRARFSGMDFAKTRHLVTIGFDASNNITSVVSPNLPDEYRDNPYGIFMRALPKPQSQTVDLRIDGKPSLIYQILLEDKEGRQMIYGAVDPYAQISDEMDIKAHQRYHQERYHQLIQLSSGTETPDLRSKREKVESLLADWRGYLYPIQYFSSPDDLRDFNNSNLLHIQTGRVLDNYQPQVKIAVSDDLSVKLGANHIPSIDEADVEGYQATMTKIPPQSFLFDDDAKVAADAMPYVWAQNVTPSLTGDFNIAKDLVKVNIPFYLSSKEGIPKYINLALQAQCDIGWKERAALESRITAGLPPVRVAALTKLLRERCRAKISTRDFYNHYYLIHSDWGTEREEIDTRVFKHVGIDDAVQRQSIVEGKQRFLDKIENLKSYFYTMAVLYRYIPEKGILIQDSAGVPTPDILVKKNLVEATLKIQFDVRLAKEKEEKEAKILGATDFVGLRTKVERLYQPPTLDRARVVTGVDMAAATKALQGALTLKSPTSGPPLPTASPEAGAVPPPPLA